MSRRKTVALNLEVVQPLIKKVCRSNTVFCEMMERGAANWVSDWSRTKDGKPAPKNLPSPQEAAKMCKILHTTPEEILVKPEDIQLVKKLLDEQTPPTLNEQGERDKYIYGVKQLMLAAPEDKRRQCFLISKILLEGGSSGGQEVLQILDEILREKSTPVPGDRDDG